MRQGTIYQLVRKVILSVAILNVQAKLQLLDRVLHWGKGEHDPCARII